jgi:branched-chain amino acid transport system permease protein
MLRKARVVLLAIGILVVPLLTNSNYLLRLVNIALIFGMLSVSLNIVLGYTGQIALGHAAFFGIGAYAAALMTAKGSGLMFWPAFVAAGVITGAFGLLIGIPTLRLKGRYLALATLGFGEIGREIFFNWREVTHGMDGIAGIPAPSLGFLTFGTDKSFFYLALIILAVLMLVTTRIERSKYGRHFAAIRDAEMAAGTCGINVSKLKIVAFGISATVAGFAGSLYAHLTTFISPDVFVFDVTAQILSMVLIGGIGTTWGPVLGAFMLTFLPELLRVSKAYYQLFYGVGIVVLIVFLPMGLLGLWRRWRPQDVTQPESKITIGSPAADYTTAVASSAASADSTLIGISASIGASSPNYILETRQLTCRFFGLVAIDDLELGVQRGTIHALIGPNGSGKSTFINLASGVYRRTFGTILFDGHSIETARPWQIADHGLVRTFQTLRLFKSLTVLDNVLVGCRTEAESGWGGVLLGTRKSGVEESELRRRAHEALDFMGVLHLRNQLVNKLPHEQQRLVEIARAFAMRPKLILLDEPAAGMNPTEVERLIQCMMRMRDRGITILLVEHNMPFVMRVADRVTVLNSGRKIAEGDAASVRNNAEVIKAYLGERVSKRLSQHALA